MSSGWVYSMRSTDPSSSYAGILKNGGSKNIIKRRDKNKSFCLYPWVIETAIWVDNWSYYEKSMQEQFKDDKVSYGAATEMYKMDIKRVRGLFKMLAHSRADFHWVEQWDPDWSKTDIEEREASFSDNKLGNDKINEDIKKQNKQYVNTKAAKAQAKATKAQAKAQEKAQAKAVKAQEKLEEKAQAKAAKAQAKLEAKAAKDAEKNRKKAEEDVEWKEMEDAGWKKQTFSYTENSNNCGKNYYRFMSPEGKQETSLIKARAVFHRNM